MWMRSTVLNRQVEEVLSNHGGLYMEYYAGERILRPFPSNLELPILLSGGRYYQTGLLTAPLRDRAELVQHLEFYTPQELKTIIATFRRVLGVEIDPEGGIRACQTVQENFARHGKPPFKRVKTSLR